MSMVGMWERWTAASRPGDEAEQSSVTQAQHHMSWQLVTSWPITQGWTAEPASTQASPSPHNRLTLSCFQQIQNVAKDKHGKKERLSLT